MTKRIKLILAGLLLTVTAFAVGLTLSSWSSAVEASKGSASSSPAQAQAQPDAAQADAIAQADAAYSEAFGQADVQAQTTPTAPATPSSGPGGKAGPGPAGRPGFGPGMMGKPGSNDNSPEAQGIITKVENNGLKLTINNRRVVNLNDQTVIGDANGTLKAADLKQNDRITAVGKAETDQSLTARWVLRLPAPPSAERGTITALDATAKTIKFKTGDGSEWTATLTATAKIYKDKKEVAQTDLKVGDNVIAVGKANRDAKTIEAESVTAGLPIPPGAPKGRGNNLGAVKSVDAAGNSFVVTQKDGTTDKDVKVVVDSNTRFAGTDLKALSDLKAGDNVVIIGEKQSDGSIKARAVTRGPAKKTGEANGYFIELDASLDAGFFMDMGNMFGGDRPFFINGPWQNSNG